MEPVKSSWTGSSVALGCCRPKKRVPIPNADFIKRRQQHLEQRQNRVESVGSHERECIALSGSRGEVAFGRCTMRIMRTEP